ncbi:MAG: phytoene desaturase family protein [Mobilitalea sp.]|jgi:phytoene dehydrogenase-like protein
MSNRDYDVITIGAGYTGLMTSALLARDGKKVCCLEMNDHVGGICSNAHEWPGYTHNRGAWYMMFLQIGWLWEALDLKKYGLELHHPPCGGVIIPEKGRTPFLLYHDRKEIFKYVGEAFGPEVLKGLMGFYKLFEPFAAVMGTAMRNPPMSIGQMIDAVPGIQAKDAMRRIFYGNVHSILDEYFPDKEKSAAIRGQLMTSGTDGFFGGPMTPGSALTIAYHTVAPDEGAGGGAYVLPKGHMGKFPEALADCLKDLGGEIHLNSEIKRIIIEKGEAVGVELVNGQQMTADVIVSSLDAYNTFINLVDHDLMDPYVVKQVKNINYQEHLCQAYVALNGLPEFGPGPYEHLNDGGWRFMVALNDPDLYETNWDLVKNGKIPEKFTGGGFYIPSMIDDTLAPAGHYSMSMFTLYGWPLGTPANKVEETKKIVGDRWMKHLKEYFPNLDSVVDDFKVQSPPDYERQYHVTGGTWTHGMVQIDQMFNMRPILGMSDYRGPFKNMYLCGTSNHPGPGITACQPVSCYNAINADAKKKK